MRLCYAYATLKGRERCRGYGLGVHLILLLKVDGALEQVIESLHGAMILDPQIREERFEFLGLGIRVDEMLDSFLQPVSYDPDYLQRSIR